MKYVVIAMILLSFPVMVGLLAALMVFLHRLVSSTACPHCYRRIPKDAINNVVPCPDCGVELGGTRICLSPGEFDDVCRVCDTPLRHIQSVELWDGHRYCRPCVEQHAPCLIQFTNSDLLSEDMPFSIPAIASRMFLFVLTSTTGFAGAIGLLFVIAGHWQEALGGFVVFLLGGLSVTLLWTGAAAFAMPLLRPKLMAWKGKFIVRFGTRLLVAPLMECSWNEGRVAQMTVWKYSFLLRGAAVIVELPKGNSMKRRRVAVGFTPDTFDAWKSFFTIAGVPRTPSRRSLWSRLGRGKGGS